MSPTPTMKIVRWRIGSWKRNFAAAVHMLAASWCILMLVFAHFKADICFTLCTSEVFGEYSGSLALDWSASHTSVDQAELNFGTMM